MPAPCEKTLWAKAPAGPGRPDPAGGVGLGRADRYSCATIFTTPTGRSAVGISARM